MESRQVLKIGIYDYRFPPEGVFIENIDYLFLREHLAGQMAIFTRDYLMQYSEKFDKASFLITSAKNLLLPNGTKIGLLGHVNRSDVDIGAFPCPMSEDSTESVDFAYPFRVYADTFITRKPEYKPHISGILQTFPLSMWIAIMTVLVALSLSYYVVFKRKYTFGRVAVDVFAVLLRQSSLLRPSSVAENLLIYSWVAGAMFICLAYDSVFLSFLSIPPVNQIKNVEQLAKAVKSGDYHCTHTEKMLYAEDLLNTEIKSLQIIGEDLVKNDLDLKSFVKEFMSEKCERNIAFITDVHITHHFEGVGFISDDTFLASLYAMPVRRDFCCKELLETFVHRLTASGLLDKIGRDGTSKSRTRLLRYPHLLKNLQRETVKRKLNLTDLAPAFLFLLFGYFTSFLVFIGEILIYKKKVRSLMKNMKRKSGNNV